MNLDGRFVNSMSPPVYVLNTGEPSVTQRSSSLLNEGRVCHCAFKKTEDVPTCYHIPNKMTDQSVAQLFHVVSFCSEETEVHL